MEERRRKKEDENLERRGKYDERDWMRCNGKV
jgi:hypothetical protein